VLLPRFRIPKRRTLVRKLWKFAVTAGAAFSAVALFTAPAAQAAGTIPGYAWDGNAHIIVAGGSETTYYVMNSINRVWQESSNSGCLHVTGVGTNQNQCASDQPNNLFNYQGDTIAQANPSGSGGGINALNGNGGSTGTMQGTVNPITQVTRTDSGNTTNGSPTVADATATTADIGKSIVGAGIPDSTYVGPATTAASIQLSSAPDQQLNVNATATAAGVSLVIATYDCVNGTVGPNPDFGRSSRGPNTSGGSAPCGNELRADTFWGYGQDGNEVVGFNNHGTMLNSLTAPNLTAQTVFNIWNCSGGTGSPVGASRVDSPVTVTSGSPVVTDNSITNADVGHGVTGTGIPASSFVGEVNTTAHTFRLSSSANTQVDVNATAAGTSVTIAGSQRMRWSDVIPGLPGGVGGPNDGDIVPWGLNSASGTFATFNAWVIANSIAGSTWTTNNAACDRKLQPDNIFPLENDIKPLINDPQSRVDGTGGTGTVNYGNGVSVINDSQVLAIDAGKVVTGTGIPACSYVTNVTPGVSFTLSSTPNVSTPVNTSASGTAVTVGGLTTCTGAPDNPENWMWQGSIANFTAFPFLSNFTRAGTTYAAIQAAVNGVLGGPSNILDRSWPISRVIFHVTRKADADCVKTAGACDFPGHPGPALAAGGNDLNVTGATSGSRGAVREFTRALCRVSAAQQGLDPYTGASFNTALTSAINGAGFTIISALQRTPGSRCQVLS
jgi:hypothetical protein